MPVDPMIISMVLTALESVVRQLAVYSRGEMAPQEAAVFNSRVMEFMRQVQSEADTLRGRHDRNI